MRSKKLDQEPYVPWISSRKAFQKRGQFQHFPHPQSAAHQRWYQNLLCPYLSLQVESLAQVHDIPQEQQVSPNTL